MNKFFTFIFSLTFLFTGSIANAQTKQEEAAKKCREAIKLMDKGKTGEAIKLLNEAKKLDPKNIDYPYEIGVAHYLNQDYKKAVKVIKPLLKHEDVNPLVYQLLGNSYSLLEDRNKAISTYEEGIKKFPNAGRLYLERGNMEMFIEEWNKALAFYEKGIDMDPAYPSNYYWAAKIYLNTHEEVWGMIYGEIFVNLEVNTKRTTEISRLLYKTYQSEITFTNDTSMSVSFSKGTIAINSPDLSDFKLPFGLIVYEPTLISCIVEEKEINLESLNRIRTRFLEQYQNNHMKKYPIVLFQHQQKIKEAGHLEAYNFWLLQAGEPDSFDAWTEKNPDKWDSFVDWYNENKIVINQGNKFHRNQY